MKCAGCTIDTAPARLRMPPSAAMNWLLRRHIAQKSLPFAFWFARYIRSMVLKFCGDLADGVAAATATGACKFTIANTGHTAGATESRIWNQFAGIATT
jgi:hypothetical protein